MKESSGVDSSNGAMVFILFFGTLLSLEEMYKNPKIMGVCRNNREGASMKKPALDVVDLDELKEHAVSAKVLPFVKTQSETGEVLH